MKQFLSLFKCEWLSPLNTQHPTFFAQDSWQKDPLKDQFNLPFLVYDIFTCHVTFSRIPCVNETTFKLH